MREIAISFLSLTRKKLDVKLNVTSTTAVYLREVELGKYE